jgi:hypothetical protein
MDPLTMTPHMGPPSNQEMRKEAGRKNWTDEGKVAEYPAFLLKVGPDVSIRARNDKDLRSTTATVRALANVYAGRACTPLGSD